MFPYRDSTRRLPDTATITIFRSLARKTLRLGGFSFLRPSDSQQKGAILQSLHIVRKRSLQRQHVPGRQINHLVLHMHWDVTRDSLDRNPIGGFMFVKTYMGFQHRSYRLAHERIIVSNILNLLSAFSE